MSETAVQRFYRGQARFYDATRWLVLHGRRRAVEYLELRPDGRVLEIGCGTGLSFRYLFERLDARAGHLTGIDFSPDMLRRARRRVEANGWPNLELIEADAAAFTLPQQFDAILFAYSLSMIPNWRAALERAAKHLAPGGRLVVLDFGTFGGWGLLRVPIQAWLRLHHVDVQRPYLDGLRETFGRVEVHRGLGDYYFIAVATS